MPQPKAPRPLKADVMVEFYRRIPEKDTAVYLGRARVRSIDPDTQAVTFYCLPEDLMAGDIMVAA